MMEEWLQDGAAMEEIRDMIETGRMPSIRDQGELG